MTDKRKSRGGAPARRHGLDPVRGQRWGEVVRRALVDRSLSANAAAVAIGVSPASMSAWLNGTTEPPLRIMKPLAELVGLTPALLAALAGYMPESQWAATYQAQAATQLQQELARLRRWTDLWRAASGLGPAAIVAGTLSAASPDWRIEIVPDVRGRRFRTHHATYVGVRAMGEVDDTVLTFEVEQALEDLMTTTATVWRHPQRVLGWDDAPQHVLTTPHLERGRAPALTPVHLAPITLPVVGVTYAHAETVGALVADAWGYGYQNAAFATMEAYGVGRADDVERFVQAEMIRGWLREPLPTLDRTVWSFADHDAVDRVIPDLAVLDVPLLVAVYAGERLLTEAGATMWRAPPETILATQDRLRDALQSAPFEVVSVTIEDAAVVDPDTDRVADDLVWDAAVRAAWDLHSRLVSVLPGHGDLARFANELRDT